MDLHLLRKRRYVRKSPRRVKYCGHTHSLTHSLLHPLEKHKMQSERNQRSNIKMHNSFWWWYCWCCSRTCCCCCTCSCGWLTCWLFVYTKKHTQKHKQKKYNNNAIYRQIQSLISKCKKNKNNNPVAEWQWIHTYAHLHIGNTCRYMLQFFLQCKIEDDNKNTRVRPCPYPMWLGMCVCLFVDWCGQLSGKCLEFTCRTLIF